MAALATLIALVLCIVSTPSRAYAAPAGGDIQFEKLMIEEGPISLTITFDRPVSKSVADKLRSDLKGAHPRTAVAVADPFGCGGYNSYTTNEGWFSVQYYCNGSTKNLQWGFHIAPAVQAIVVGNVNEAGLSWWVNGHAMPRNAPHVVPPSYVLHGTMTPVIALTYVDYQDYMTFRHNIGPGGSGTITFAGSLWLYN